MALIYVIKINILKYFQKIIPIKMKIVWIVKKENKHAINNGHAPIITIPMVISCINIDSASIAFIPCKNSLYMK